jgi:2-methylcitrate dehydratase PrpD
MLLNNKKDSVRAGTAARKRQSCLSGPNGGIVRITHESQRPRRASSRATSADTPDAGPTRTLARFVSGIRYRALPKPVVERAKDLVLDHVGVSIVGAQLPWTQRVRAVVLADGRGDSTLYGGGRVSPRNAALANGAAGHAIEFDDTHDESLGHPGCVVIPAALALAEARDASGRDFLTAMVAGYEAQCRVGSPLGRPLIERGMHPTATCGVFGSAAAAGHLLGLREDALVSAFGSAISMASGVMQFSEDPAGTMIKRLHGGLPAERGLLAALLASSGYSGPRQSIEGKYGFAAVLAAASANLDRITDGLGERFEIERISVKLYPCCKQFHSLIEAVAECRAKERFGAADIAAIEPFGPRAMIDTHMEYRPASTMSAQYSLPYTTAVALLLDPTDPESFEASARARKDVLALVDLVKPVQDEALQAHYPRRFPGGIRLRLRDGRQVEASVLDSRSSPERPITHEDVQRKFLSLTASLLSPARQQRIIERVATLERGSVRDLAALLRAPLGTRGPAPKGGRRRRTTR